MKHPFDEERCARRLLWEYQNYNRLIVGVDNGDTINNYKTYQIVWTENSK